MKFKSFTFFPILLLLIALCGTGVAQAGGTATQAVKITDGPRVEGTGTTWAVIAWTTNTGGGSIVNYGTDKANLSQTARSPYAKSGKAGAQNHRVRIANLKPGTTYYFVADSGQGQGTGTDAKSAVAEFKTKGTAPSAAKSEAVKITDGPRVEGTGGAWAVIAWTTNVGGSSVIRYGTDQNSLSQTAQSPYSNNPSTKAENHRVRIAGLKPGTTYYFSAESGQGEGTGTVAKSPVGNFTTKGNAGKGNAGKGNADKDEKGEAVKIIDGPKVEATTGSTATIAWTTNTGGSSVVKYGTDKNNMTQTAQSPYADKEGAKYQSHRVQIKNLKPSTTYYFQVVSGQGDGTGTEAKGAVGSFSTKAQ